MPDNRITKLLRGAHQRHHDIFVRLYREKGEELSYDERENYDLAMKRERLGLVDPLPEDESGKDAAKE